MVLKNDHRIQTNDQTVQKNDQTIQRNNQGKLPAPSGFRRTRAGALALTLGLTATLVAGSTVKRVMTAESGKVAVTQTATSGDHAAAAKRRWYQIGKASWYGTGFNGKPTANGETFDMYALTCAHRTLPLGSWVRVTNLINKKTAFLRVNDRGPMATSLVMDLSFGAARRLGVNGLAKVRIDPVSTTDPQLAEELVARLHLADDPAVLASAATATGLLPAAER